ncbi:hypothetical protein DAEQUDRAFT_337808 [Daedalea quercina L-15889]|uniref:DUF1793-domain-containing protein n=1 Tax=Daedalea quercina L-15889 TaxID=1314783 RepID=A0A165PJC1_9APHY|nr:hypothetical protein DAEQUDRAFT_337808 [Daedalea quercina L-15889]
MIFSAALYLLSLLAVTRSQMQIQTFWPAAAPLAVHSPYLNVWQTAISTNDYPIFWNGSVLGWVGFIRVDGSTYRWLGNNYDMSGSVGAVGCNVTFTEVTPTRTIQNVQAGPMNVTLTFLSPIEPSDWVKQSIPFSYLAVEFASTDGKEHDVQLYSDISAEWVSANKETVEWSSNQTDTVVYHSIVLEQPQPFTEAYQQASDGTAYYAMSLGSGPSAGWQTCQNTVCYETFYASGALNSKNSNDTYRGITTDLPVFAFSVDFGNVSATQSPVVWAVGYARDPSIEYSLEEEVTTLRPYYSTQYSNIEDVIEAFVSDYDNALSRAETLDSQVQQAAANVSSGSEYYNMLSLATRQAFGALDLTAPGSDGSIRFFMKDIGFSNRVNPVESLYAALPVYLYCNSSMVKSLLLPLLEQQNASSYTSNYAAKDIGEISNPQFVCVRPLLTAPSGTSYPSVSGPTAASNEGVEQSGNMLIMVLAHAVNAGDSSLLGSYYALLKTWADYLVTNALHPSNQASVDTRDVASNSTNLSLKGIIGIQAMSNISSMLGKDDDAQHYSSVASQYIGSWKALAMSSDSSHILPTYGDSSSDWSLSYNIYAHTLLDLHLLDDTIFSSITSYYQELLSNYAYGLPIDSDHDTLGSAVWTSFTAAALTDASTRQQMLSHLWKFASSNTTTYPFPSRYAVSNGSYLHGTSGPGCFVCAVGTE